MYIIRYLDVVVLIFPLQDMILAAGRTPTRPIKRRSSDAVTPKQQQFNYKIKVSGGTEYDVCPHAYQSIHGVSERRVRYAYEKAKKSDTGTPAPDARGRRK